MAEIKPRVKIGVSPEKNYIQSELGGDDHFSQSNIKATLGAIPRILWGLPRAVFFTRGASLYAPVEHTAAAAAAAAAAAHRYVRASPKPRSETIRENSSIRPPLLWGWRVHVQKVFSPI